MDRSMNVSSEAEAEAIVIGLHGGKNSDKAKYDIMRITPITLTVNQKI